MGTTCVIPQDSEEETGETCRSSLHFPLAHSETASRDFAVLGDHWWRSNCFAQSHEEAHTRAESGGDAHAAAGS